MRSLPRFPDGVKAVTMPAEPLERAAQARSIRGTFSRGNRFGGQEYRERCQRDPIYAVRRCLREVIAKLRSGRMQPPVANALILALRLQLELIDRAQTAATLEEMQHEIDRLTDHVRDLVGATSVGGAR
jgi:hypothetical protein